MENKLPKLAEWLIPIVTCFIGLHFTILGICHYDLSMIPGDLGDARFNMYLLEHGFQYITRQVHFFWGAPFFYPYSPALALSDNLLGSMPIYAVFRMLAFDRETAFQLWYVSLCILNFVATFFVLKRLTKHTILASAGAYIFAFSIFLFCQFHHAQTFPRFIAPMVLFWIIMFFKNFQLKFVWYAMLGLIYQFYCAMYLGIFLSLVSLVLVLILFSISFKDGRSRHAYTPIKLLKLTLPIIIFFVLLVPVTYHYWKVYSTVDTRRFAEIFRTMPIPSSYFFTAKASVTWNILSDLGIRDNVPWWDQEMFVGIIPWLAIITSIFFFTMKGFFANNKILFSILLALLVCIALTIRIKDFTLFKWLFMVPGISSMGTVPRIMNMFLLFFAMIPCLLLNSIIKKRRNMWFSFLLLAIIIENISEPSLAEPFSKEMAQARVTPIVEQLKNVNWEGKKAFAYMPKSGNEFEIQLDAMMASQLVHKPCVNGYSAIAPPNFDAFWRMFNEETLYHWLDINKIGRGDIVEIH